MNGLVFVLCLLIYNFDIVVWQPGDSATAILTQATLTKIGIVLLLVTFWQNLDIIHIDDISCLLDVQ